MRFGPLLLRFTAVLVFGFMLAACDEAEQGRILNYEKGTYLGKKDQTLSDRDIEELRHRTRMQQGT